MTDEGEERPPTSAAGSFAATERLIELAQRAAASVTAAERPNVPSSTPHPGSRGLRS